MCKVFSMTNMSNVKITKKFLNIVRDEVCKTTDKDGFGYAILSDDGAIGGERTMKPMSFNALSGDPDKLRTASLPIVSRTRNVFGKIDFRKPKSFIAHGRYSTNTVNLENTHPFVNDDIAMIHNGVVSDADNMFKNLLKTSCDTEIILRAWEHGGMKTIESQVTGYYALAILDKVTKQLHIVRDDKAMLYISYSRTVDSYIIATTIDIIQSVAKKMKWVCEQPEELLENIHVVFDRNEIMSQTDIDPRVSYNKTMTSTERTALGYTSYADYAQDKYGSRSSANMGGWTVGDLAAASRGAKESANVFDATTGEILMNDDDEPAYRREYQEAIPYSTQVEMDELDRQMVESAARDVATSGTVDDGAPNVTVWEETETESAYESAYHSAYDTRKIS